jgi:hypothetical protein
MALTAYEAAVAAKPKEKITLRHGAARSAIDAPTDGPLPRVAGRSAQIEECRADVAAQVARVVLEPLERLVALFEVHAKAPVAGGQQ